MLSVGVHRLVGYIDTHVVIQSVETITGYERRVLTVTEKGAESPASRESTLTNRPHIERNAVECARRGNGEPLSGRDKTAHFGCVLVFVELVNDAVDSANTNGLSVNEDFQFCSFPQRAVIRCPVICYGLVLRENTYGVPVL